jgi:predicted transcriptional regulator
MNNPKPIPLEHHLQLLEIVEANPQITQADLATRLGVAVGTVNWYLKRLVSKGYIKIKRLQRRRLLYLITPRGLSEKSRLGVRYLRISLHVYREMRIQAGALLTTAREAGYSHVMIQGNGDWADICRLTCLEQGMRIEPAPCGETGPVLLVDGAQIKLVLPDKRPELGEAGRQEEHEQNDPSNR